MAATTDTPGLLAHAEEQRKLAQWGTDAMKARGQRPAVYDDALHLMETLGGSFVRSLAACYYAADPVNKEKLRAAFASYFESYEARFQAQQRAIAAGAAS